MGWCLFLSGESTLYVPDSGSESDVFDESTTRGVGGEQSTLYLEDDSQIHQEDEDDFSATAATQAYTTGGDDGKILWFLLWHHLDQILDNIKQLSLEIVWHAIMLRNLH